MGAYTRQNNATEFLILVGFGIFATILKFATFPLAPLLIGFILGTMLEDNFARSILLLWLCFCLGTSNDAWIAHCVINTCCAAVLPSPSYASA